MFEIQTTRNCEGTNKLPNSKFAMLFLQNCDLLIVFNKHQNFEFLKKKNRKHHTKNPTNQNILFPHFTSLFQNSKL